MSIDVLLTLVFGVASVAVVLYAELSSLRFNKHRAHSYKSTACFHTEHTLCRTSCKFCHTSCRCWCHKEIG